MRRFSSIGAREQHRLLKHDADVPPQRQKRQIAYVDPVYGHAARRRIEDAMQQPERRGFARAGGADQRDGFAGRRREGHVAHRHALAVIGIAHLFERHRARKPPGVSRIRPVGDRRARIQNVEELGAFSPTGGTAR